ncbi:hypothetical protein ACQKPX_15330 [Photobacterium sp. DNB23_23_1]
MKTPPNTHLGPVTQAIRESDRDIMGWYGRGMLLNTKIEEK